MSKQCKSCFSTYDDSFDMCPHCGYYEGATVEMINQLPIGYVLADRYVLGKVLGFGGFGITYIAWDMQLESVVAIKEFFPSSFVNRNPTTHEVIVFGGKRRVEYDAGIARFLDEAKNMAKFSSNDNIVNAYEFFKENNTAYIVMEYLEGEALNTYLRTHSFSVEESVDVAIHLCSALQDIHDEGILHRDVSPDNIFMCKDGRVKVIDFGAARLSSEEEKLRTIILKPGFAPPEQYESISMQGPWTDIYALGATLYYLVTGVKPEESTNRKINDKVVPPHELNPEVPENTSNAIMKAMAVNRHMRFSSCEEFKKALKNEKTVVPLKKEEKRRKTRRALSVAAALIVVFIVAGVFSNMLQHEVEEKTLPRATISLMYVIENPENDAKGDALQKIVDDFLVTYSNVTIEVEGIEPDKYDETMRSALGQKDKGILFENRGLELDETLAVPLFDILSEKLNMQNYYLLDSYFKTGDTFKIPLGFDLPVIYANKKRSEFSDSKINYQTLSEYQEKGIVLKSDAAALFSGAFETDVNGLKPETDTERFYEGNAAFLLADIEEFPTVNKRFGGRYEIVMPDVSKIPCIGSDFFSVSKGSKDQIKVGSTLLRYMLHLKYQDNYHNDGASGTLPINKEMFNRYIDIFGQLTSVKDLMKKAYYIGA